MNDYTLYEDTNKLLWKVRLDCYTNKNEVGHNFICRVVTRLNTEVKNILQDAV